MTETSYADRLRSQLVEAAGRRRKRLRWRRYRRWLVAPGALAVVGITAAMWATSSEPAAAGVEVTRRGDRLEVRLVDDEHREDVIEDTLAANGIDVDVMLVSVGPSLVGRMLNLESAPPDVEPVDPAGTATRGFSVPADWTGRLTLQVGEPAGDEPYQQPSDAFAPGEPLACSGVEGETLADARDRLDDLDLEVTYAGPQAAGAVVPITGEELDTGRYDAWRIAGGIAFSSRDVRVVLTPTGDPVLPQTAVERAECDG